MPRGRGGKRDGVVGKSYSNRTDLQGQNVVAAQPQNQPGVKLATQAATGQPYGAATAQENAMKAVPIQNTGTPMSAMSPQGVPAQPAPRIQRATTPLYAPTERPDEAITTGIDLGAGAGSESLQMNSKFAQEKLSTTLAQMLPYDQTGEIGILYQQALSRGM